LGFNVVVLSAMISENVEPYVRLGDRTCRFSAQFMINAAFGFRHDLAGVTLGIQMTISAVDIFGRNLGLFSFWSVIERILGSIGSRRIADLDRRDESE
jgi:hypothetical protein